MYRCNLCHSESKPTMQLRGTEADVQTRLYLCVN